MRPRPGKRSHQGPFSSLSRVFSLSDEEAMLRVRDKGDARAFGLIVRRWEGPLQALCMRMTGDRHRAEDLTQETFARLFAHRTRYRPEARLSTFLWRMALNLCHDELRRAARRGECSIECAAPPAHPAEPADPSASPEKALVDEERAQSVQQALGQLPEHYRDVVVLRHYEGLKFREIADVLQIPEGTVKSRMSEALTRLARRLRPGLCEEID